jgi:hypothetical protein
MEPNAMQWKDAEGDLWSTAIKFEAAVRLRETQNVDLLNPSSMESLFGADPMQRIEAIAELSRAQWEERGLAYSDFVDRLLSGNRTFAEATIALKAALSDFFRRLDRADLAVVADRAWAAMDCERKLREKAAKGDKVGKVLDTAVAKADQMIDAALDKSLEEVEQLGNTSGSSLASVVSIGVP